MTIQEFNKLSNSEKEKTVLGEENFLSKSVVLNNYFGLYSVGNFLVEVNYDPKSLSILNFRSFPRLKVV
jgi:hypothetical protein